METGFKFYRVTRSTGVITRNQCVPGMGTHWLTGQREPDAFSLDLIGFQEYTFPLGAVRGPVLS
jgi:hypothetical protein